MDVCRGDGKGPMRVRLEREIRAAVQAGRLLAGTTLPSTRVLAAQLGVSRGLIVEAYAQLVAEGYLSARQGTGTVVAARAAKDVARPTASAPAHAAAGVRVRYDFRTNIPDLSAFPRAAWLAASARTLRALPDARLDYGDARGAIELRVALASWLGRSRGVVADPARVVICGGARDALSLVWRVLRDRGLRRVAIEDPGWRAQRETVLQAGLEAVPVAIDEHGIRVDDLWALDVDASIHRFAGMVCPVGAVK